MIYVALYLYGFGGWLTWMIVDFAMRSSNDPRFVKQYKPGLVWTATICWPILVLVVAIWMVSSRCSAKRATDH